MPEPKRWNYLEFEPAPQDGAASAYWRPNRFWYLEIDGQERIYTGARLESRLLRRYLPEPLARRYQAIPIECKQGVLKVAMTDPTNRELCQELERELGGKLRVAPCRTTPEVIQQALALYRQDELPAPAPLRLHRAQALAPSPWIHTPVPYRAHARTFWPLHLRALALTLLIISLLFMFLEPLRLAAHSLAHVH